MFIIVILILVVMHIYIKVYSVCVCGVIILFKLYKRVLYTHAGVIIKHVFVLTTGMIIKV